MLSSGWIHLKVCTKILIIIINWFPATCLFNFLFFTYLIYLYRWWIYVRQNYQRNTFYDLQGSASCNNGWKRGISNVVETFDTAVIQSSLCNNNNTKAFFYLSSWKFYIEVILLHRVLQNITGLIYSRLKMIEELYRFSV